MARKASSALPEFPKDVKFVECADCGEPTSNLKPGERCYQCSVTAATTKEASREKVLASAGVPKKYIATPFKERPWPVDRDRSMALDQWSGDPWCAYLVGDCGTGKTMFSVELIFRWLCDTGRRGQFIKAAKLPGIYFSRDQQHLVERLERVPLLVVDELGRGHLGNAWEAVTELLAARYDEILPTVITTNMPLDELAATDEHVADRIGEGLVLVFSGRSERDG